MNFSSRKLNTFIMLKLPSAWLTGVRIKEISRDECITTVKHRWINQNPFNSLYFAVQAMAAELSTGALVMKTINEEKKTISMLVTQNRSQFTKKAKGRIRFICKDGRKVSEAISAAIDTGEGQSFWMSSTGINEEGEEVSHFEFEWSIKMKNFKPDLSGKTNNNKKERI